MRADIGKATMAGQPTARMMIDDNIRLDGGRQRIVAGAGLGIDQGIQFKNCQIDLIQGRRFRPRYLTRARFSPRPTVPLWAMEHCTGQRIGQLAKSHRRSDGIGTGSSCMTINIVLCPCSTALSCSIFDFAFSMYPVASSRLFALSKRSEKL